MKATIGILLICLLFNHLSCNQPEPQTTTKVLSDSSSISAQNEAGLVYPALYTNWEIGSRDNLNKILTMYKDWDEMSVAKMKDYFADSVVVDMPDGKRTSGSKEEVVAKMEQFRNAYTNTENQVLNAIPLRNKDTDFDWVRVMVYNKWVYKDNKKRDSMLYYDIWRLKEGKINYLLSFEQSPSRMQFKQLEKMAGDLKNK